MVDKPIERLVPQRHRHQHTGDRIDYQADPKLRPMGVGRELYGLRKDVTEFPVEIALSRSRRTRADW